MSQKCSIDLKKLDANIRVASIQWQFSQYASSSAWWAEMEWQIRVASQEYGANVIVFPEYLYADHPNDWPTHEEVYRNLTDFSKKYDVWIVGGSLPYSTHQGLYNRCWVSGPQGEIHHQDKIHITPWESSTWNMVGGNELLVIDALGIKIGIAICYDVEFPEQVRALAELGIELLCVPYCTDDVNGHHRVTHCARARAVENTIYVVTAGCAGSLRTRDGFAHHYASSVIATPCDIGYPPAGIAASAEANLPQCIVSTLDMAKLRESRRNGTTLPLANLRRDLFGSKSQKCSEKS